MALDPVTLAAVNNLRPPIGSLVQVAGIADPRLVATGEIIDVDEYPKLAAALPASSQVNFYEEIPYGITGGAVFSTTVETGWPIKAVVQDDDVFIVCVQTSTYVNARGFAINIFKSVAGKDYSAGWTWVNTVELPWHNTASHCTVIGDSLYISSASSAVRKYDLSDLTFQTFITLNLTFGASAFVEGGGTLLAYTVATTGSTGNIRASTDGGATWVNTTVFSTTGVLNRITYGNGLFVAVTSGTATANVARSANGLTWTPQLVGNSGHSAAHYLGGYFVLTPLGTSAYYTSSDGVAYASSTVTVPGLAAVSALSDGTTIFSGGYFAGASPNYLTSASLLIGAGPVGAAAVNKPYSTSMAHLVVEDTILLFTSYAASGQNFCSYSTNKGATWLGTKLFEMPGEPTRYLLPAVSADKSTIVALECPASKSSSPTVAATVRGVAIVDGVRTQFSINTSVGVTWKAVLVNPSKPRSFYAWAMNGSAPYYVLASSDDGINWTVLSPTYTGFTVPAFGFFTVIGNDGSVAIYSSATSVGVSVDGGRTFTSKSISSSGTTAAGAFLNRVIFMTTTGVTVWTDWLTVVTPTGWTSSPAATAFGADATRAVFTCANSNTYYYSFDGISWIKATLPAVVVGGNPAFVGEWVMIPTGNGAAYRTKDFATWELITIGDNSKYVTDQISDLMATTDNTLVMGANTTKKVPYFLMQNRGTLRKKRVPKRASDNGMIWAVVAK